MTDTKELKEEKLDKVAGGGSNNKSPKYNKGDYVWYKCGLFMKWHKFRVDSYRYNSWAEEFVYELTGVDGEGEYTSVPEQMLYTEKY